MHCTHTKSLPVSTTEVKVCAGVPKLSVIRYSPLVEDDTIGLSNSELDASVPQSFRSIASLRSFDRFTAAANRSRRDAVAFAGLSGDSG